MQESGNPKIQPGAPGYFEATSARETARCPDARVDRSMGDIHPLGNPHVQLDPHNVAAVAKALSARLAAIDPANAAYYQARGADFQARWQQAITRWDAQAAPLKGVTVVVIHTRPALSLPLARPECRSRRSSPSPACRRAPAICCELVTKLSADKPKLILRNAYNDPKAADWLSQKIGVPVVVLPFSVGGTPEAKDLFGLFDDTINRLLAAGK